MTKIEPPRLKLYSIDGTPITRESPPLSDSLEDIFMWAFPNDFPSKSSFRRALEGGAIRVNDEKILPPKRITKEKK